MMKRSAQQLSARIQGAHFHNTRREFLADVGQGMLVASIGAALAADLGLANAHAAMEPGPLTFGKFEALAALMQETPAEKLLPILTEKCQAGTDLATLVAAAALANARTFGGQDYIGFHTFMALPPALAMSRELPAARQALPVFKVLYRNAQRMQAMGGRANEVLHPVEAAELPAGSDGGLLLQQATRQADRATAEKTFAALAQGPVGEAFNHLQFAVQDEIDVHRVVLAWRAWSALDITGQEFAHTLLRQSVLYCVNDEERRRARGRTESPVRTVLPKLLDQYQLIGRSPGTRKADDAWIESTSKLIANATREQAADAVAAALAEGIAPEDVGEAIALAANELVLRDRGRDERNASAEKPAGSVHGDSVGVHASDAANAWRNIARASNPRNAVASLIIGAFHTAGQTKQHDLSDELNPHVAEVAKIQTATAEELLRALAESVEAKDQVRACALVTRYGELDLPARGVFDTLLKYAISEDGALHAEKYYRTVTEEFATTRPAFRWRQLAALARVTASEYGRPAPGYQEACELLKV